MFFSFSERTTLTFVVLSDNSTDSVYNLDKEKKFIRSEDVVMTITGDVTSDKPTDEFPTISGFPVTRIYSNVTLEEPVPGDDEGTFWTSTGVVVTIAVVGAAIMAAMGALTAKLISCCRDLCLGYDSCL